MTTEKQVVIAKNYEIFRTLDSSNHVVDLMWCNVYGHPMFKDGERVRTSKILDKKEDLVETANTIYKLEQ